LHFGTLTINLYAVVIPLNTIPLAAQVIIYLAPSRASELRNASEYRNNHKDTSDVIRKKEKVITSTRKKYV